VRGSKYAVIIFFIHDTNIFTYNIYSYSLVSLLHFAASFTPSSGSSTPGLKTYYKILTFRWPCIVIYSYNTTNSLTPWCRVLLEKLTGLQLVKKFPAFHGTRRCITALTSVRHLSLSWASPIQSIYSHPTSWRYVLILSSHLRLGLPSGLFPNQLDALVSQVYFVLKLYMFRTVPLSIIRNFSLYTQQWYISHRFADSLLLSCTCTVLFQNKFVKLLHLVGVIIRILV